MLRSCPIAARPPARLGRVEAEAALAVAAGVHLGFQLTVTAVVYPTVAATPAHRWRAAHDAHSRAITPVVVVVYGALVAAGGWAAASGPGPWTWVALAGAAASMGCTAVVAAPTHGRLATEHQPRLVRRLLVADRVRTTGAVVALLGALGEIL